MVEPWGVPRCNNCGVRHTTPPVWLQAATSALIEDIFSYKVSRKPCVLIVLENISHALKYSRWICPS